MPTPQLDRGVNRLMFVDNGDRVCGLLGDLSPRLV
jgi:hypothetical protein